MMTAIGGMICESNKIENIERSWTMNAWYRQCSNFQRNYPSFTHDNKKWNYTIRENFSLIAKRYVSSQAFANVANKHKKSMLSTYHLSHVKLHWTFPYIIQRTRNQFYFIHLHSSYPSTDNPVSSCHFKHQPQFQMLNPQLEMDELCACFAQKWKFMFRPVDICI